MPISLKHPGERNISERMTDKVKRLAEIRKEKRKIARYVKDLNIEERAIGKSVIEYLKQEEWESLKVKGVGTAFIKENFTCYVLKGNRRDAIKWLKAKGHSDIIVVKPNEKRLPLVIKQILKDPNEIVPKYFQWDTHDKLGFTTAGSTKKESAKKNVK